MEVKTFYILPKIEKIKISDINTNTPLKSDIGDENVIRLAANIKKNGLINPLYVRKDINAPKKYILVSGHRRLKALTFLGVKNAPAVVLSLTDIEAMLLPLCDEQNLSKLCPFEKARYMARVLKSGITKAELCDFIGISKTALEKELLLLTLSEEEVNIIKTLGFDSAFLYLFLNFEKEKRKDLLEKILAKNMTCDTAKKYIKDIINPPATTQKNAIISNDTLIINSMERIQKQLEQNGIDSKFKREETGEKKQYIIEVIK